MLSTLGRAKKMEKGKRIAGILLALVAFLAINPITRMLGADAAILDYTMIKWILFGRCS